MESIGKLTHICNDRQIYIQNIKSTDTNTFEFTIKNPLSHFHFNDFYWSQDRIDPLYLLECCRQAETFIAHKYFNVGFEEKFIFNCFSLSLREQNSLLLLKHGEIKGCIYSEMSTNACTRMRNNVYVFTIFVSNIEVCAITLSASYLKKHVYQKIRNLNFLRKNLEFNLDDNVNCKLVGYMNQLNSIISLNNKNKASIVINKNNPIYFDHKQDHITGMNIVEGCRQFSFYCVKDKFPNKLDIFEIDEINSEFFSFVELYAEAVIILKELIVIANKIKLIFSIEQESKTKCSVSVVLRIKEN
ncbi:AfsA-related hotdog domain-containing protein [Vibrio spartinae]|uniref:A-factor biosynthesis hotdog domain protein n=1 Tax=Vibrio spartinae TaxID=1918945 RepID=A0A1N6M915_9VIBR|nr:AfsA-related hotdog domain-containing protein [Vibrio spartinae]SIO95904.1 A-factor biosynthesis hotdog domain protein [Vibrio spartinae]